MVRIKYSKSMKINCYFDGCCEPVNPGGTASYGAVIFDGKKRIWDCSKIFFPQKGKEKETSNNVAEYSGFIAILEYLLENNLDGNKIIIHGDSNLVIQQMLGKWKIKKGYYVPFAYKARELLGKFKKQPTLVWIPREKNDIADELSKAELVKAGVEFRIQPLD
jgi:ribonuclease HI